MKSSLYDGKTVLQFTSLLFGSGGDGSMVTASVFFWSLSCRESMTSYWASIMHWTVSFSSSKRIIKGILSPEYRLLLLLLFLIVHPVILFFVKHYNVISVGDVAFFFKISGSDQKVWVSASWAWKLKSCAGNEEWGDKTDEEGKDGEASGGMHLTL